MKNDFKGQAPATNNIIDRRAILLAAFALFVFGSFLGCAVYRLLGIGESELYDKLIERFFLALYLNAEGASDVISVTFDLMAHEIWYFAVVYAVGFTPFCPLVGGVLLLYRGLLFGFSLTLLQFSCRTGLLTVSAVYLMASFMLSVLLALMTLEAIQFYSHSPKLRLRDIRKTGYTAVFFKLTALAGCTVVTMLFIIYVYI